MAWDMGIKELSYELDSQTSIDQIAKPIPLFARIVVCIKQPLCRYWEVEISYTFRENLCTNALAKRGAMGADKLVLWGCVL